MAQLYILQSRRSRSLLRRNRWTWRIVAAVNGKVVAEGGEGYAHQDEAMVFPLAVAAGLRSLGYEVMVEDFGA